MFSRLGSNKQKSSGSAPYQGPRPTSYQSRDKLDNKNVSYTSAKSSSANKSERHRKEFTSENAHDDPDNMYNMRLQYQYKSRYDDRRGVKAPSKGRKDEHYRRREGYKRKNEANKGSAKRTHYSDRYRDSQHQHESRHKGT